MSFTLGKSEAVVTSLEVMESIVAENNALEWEGWDVVKYNRKPTSFMNPSSRYRNGQWHSAKVYPVTERGWIVPRSWVRELE